MDARYSYGIPKRVQRLSDQYNTASMILPQYPHQLCHRLDDESDDELDDGETLGYRSNRLLSIDNKSRQNVYHHRTPRYGLIPEFFDLATRDDRTRRHHETSRHDNSSRRQKYYPTSSEDGSSPPCPNSSIFSDQLLLTQWGLFLGSSSRTTPNVTDACDSEASLPPDLPFLASVPKEKKKPSIFEYVVKSFGIQFGIPLI